MTTFRVHYNLPESTGHVSAVAALSPADAAKELRRKLPSAIVMKVKVDRT